MFWEGFGVMVRYLFQDKGFIKTKAKQHFGPRNKTKHLVTSVISRKVGRVEVLV